VIVENLAADLGEVSRQVHPDHFVGEPGGSGDVDQRVPALGLQARFLQQFALRGAQRVLPRYVQQPGREFQQPTADGMPVLVHQGHALLVVDRGDGDRAEVLDHLPVGRAAARHRDLVDAEPDDPADVHVGAGHDGELVLAGPRIARSAGRPGDGHGSGNRSAAWYFAAASMNASNSGCGLVGLLLNSGCAWVPTKNGCTSAGSSTNSTSLPSGEVPEITRPA